MIAQLGFKFLNAARGRSRPSDAES
jgi:hypothetical protein